jgi:HEAT repeat protein
MLGQVGRYLPGELAGLETMASLLDHPVPTVRASTLRAFGKIAGQGKEPATGIPAPTNLDPFLDTIVARVADPEPTVRAAAVHTLGEFKNYDQTHDETYIDEILTCVSDPHRDVQLAGLNALSKIFEPSMNEVGALLESVIPQLTNNDDDIKAATVDFLLTAARTLSTEQPTIAQYITDLLVWFQLSSHGGFGVPDPLDELDEALVSVVDVDQYLHVAQSLRDADNTTVRHAVVSLCTTVAVHSKPHRLQAIGILQALLADEDENVRRNVLDAFKRLAEETPSLRPMLTRVTWSVAAYDPPVRQKAMSTIAVTGWDDEPTRIDPVDVQFRVLQEQQDAGEDDMSDDLDVVDSPSEADNLLVLAQAQPDSVTDAAPRLIAHLSTSDEPAPSVARAFATAVASGGTVSTETIHDIEQIVQSGKLSPAVIAWLSTLQLLATDDAQLNARARDRLHSLAERRTQTPFLSCLALLVDSQPDTVAELLLSFPAGQMLSGDRSEQLADVVTKHSRLVLRCRTPKWTNLAKPERITDSGSYRVEWPTSLAEAAPQTVPATEWLTDGFWKGDGQATATLLSTVGRAEALRDETGLNTWARHPSPEVRDVVRQLEDDGHRSLYTLPDTAIAATSEVVDTTAVSLASDSRAQCCRASEQLVSIAAHNQSLRPLVRQRLLSSTVTLEEVAAPDAILGALSMLAPSGEQLEFATADSERPDIQNEILSADPTNNIVPLLYQYATSPSSGVRDVALSAIRARSADISAHPTSILIDRLRDGDSVVRAQAARTTAVLIENGLDITSDLVDSLVDLLDGPRYVTIAACEALGHCGAMSPSMTSRVITALETRLRARERGVRRAAARAVERIGYAEPNTLEPIIDTLCDRVRTDRVVWPGLMPALSVAPLSDGKEIQRLVKPAFSALVADTDPAVTQAAGQLLVTAAETAPGDVHQRLSSIGEQLHDEFDGNIVTDFRDITTSALSTYWLFRVLSISARDTHTVIEPFGWVLTETVDYLTPSSNSTPAHDLPREDVTLEGLSRVTARVAGFGGHGSYDKILSEWPNDSTKASLDPEATAQYLIHTDQSTRIQTLETITTKLSSEHRDAVIDTLLDQPLNLNRYEALFESLLQLLDTSNDRHLHRQAVDTLLDACEAHNWEIRVHAIETITELGATSVLPADETIAHLLTLTDCGIQTYEVIANGISNLLGHATISQATLCCIMIAQYEQADHWLERRQLIISIIGQLATSHSTVRPQAVETLVRAAKDANRWVRKRAASDLAAVAEVELNALRPYKKQIERIAAGACDEVAAPLNSCFNASTK